MSGESMGAVRTDILCSCPSPKWTWPHRQRSVFLLGVSSLKEPSTTGSESVRDGGKLKPGRQQVQFALEGTVRLPSLHEATKNKCPQETLLEQTSLFR